jgi:hypothetical protein
MSESFFDISPAWLIVFSFVAWEAIAKPVLESYAARTESKVAEKVIPVLDLIFSKLDPQIPCWLGTKTGDEIVQEISKIVRESTYLRETNDLKLGTKIVLEKYDLTANANRVANTSNQKL